MARDKSKTPDDENGAPIKKSRKYTSESESGSDSRSESDEGSKRSERSRHSKRTRSKRKRSRSSSRKPGDDGEKDSYTSSSSSSESDSYSDSESGSSEEYSESEDERRRRKRRERKKREEKEKERRRRKEKEKKRRRKDREEKEEKRRKKKKEKKKKKKKDKEKGKTGAVTNLWGKYGIIRETDMWNKRPEFTAWLAEVKQVNLESLSNWDEKQMFKEFMEDHNTATFPSKKYYDLDAHHRRQMEKEMKRGSKIRVTERTIFNDEEQRRLEMLRERERQKEVEIEALKHSMQSGMAQAMKEQAQLREEMAYQYKIGNFEAAAAIQRRLDPDAAM